MIFQNEVGSFFSFCKDCKDGTFTFFWSFLSHFPEVCQGSLTLGPVLWTPTHIVYKAELAVMECAKVKLQASRLSLTPRLTFGDTTGLSHRKLFVLSTRSGEFTFTMEESKH